MPPLARPLLFVALALSSVACGGKIAPTVVEQPFSPGVGTSGYGFVGGMHVNLVDAATDRVTRTLHVDANELAGTFAVSGGARVTLREDDGHGAKSFGGVSGSVVIEPIAGSGGGSLGTVKVHVDVVFADPSDDARELHVRGDYDTVLAYEG